MCDSRDSRREECLSAWIVHPPSGPHSKAGPRAARDLRLEIQSRDPGLEDPRWVSPSRHGSAPRSWPKFAPVWPILFTSTACRPLRQDESPKLLAAFTVGVSGQVSPEGRICCGTRPSPYPRSNRHCDSSSLLRRRICRRGRSVVSRETRSFRFHVKQRVSRETRFVGDVVAPLRKADGILSRNEERE